MSSRPVETPGCRGWPRVVAAARSGFTLLELLLAVSVMSFVATVTAIVFATASTAWQRGIAISDSLNHGDYVMDQLSMGLRSAFYPGGDGGSSEYGFWHEDNGDGDGTSDTISWVKLGSSLVGRHCDFAGTPHRVEFFLEDDGDGDAVAIRAWRLFGQPEDFDPEDVDPEYISNRVSGFSCRAGKKIETDGEIDWEDEWEDTNSIPPAVEITLYLVPNEEGGDTIELTRIVELTVAKEMWERDE